MSHRLPARRQRARRATTWPLWALALLLAVSPALPAEILPFADLEVGMSGTGRTVWSGDRVEGFRVEIVGLLENIFPGHDLILVRCSGGRIAEGGIAQGMSGSPIYIKDKLIGALAYTWGFATEPIAGVTPIEEMEASTRGGSPAEQVAAPPGRVAALFEPHELEAFFPALLARSPMAAKGNTLLRPIGLPLHSTGFLPEVMADLAPALGAPLVPMAGEPSSSGGDAAAAVGPPVPGSAIGVQLVAGDLNLTAIGTVTRVEEDQLLAFGHPFLNIGPTEMAMTAARVHLVVPSLQSSFKVASPAGVVGTVRQDRRTGLRGTLGPGPRPIPLRVEVSGDGGEPRRFAFDLVDDPLLTPILVNYVVRNVLSAAEKDLGPMTIELLEGSQIRLENQEPVQLANFFSGDLAAPFTSGLPAYILYLLMNNEFVKAPVEEVTLLLDFQGRRRSARIAEVWADRERVRPGDTVRLHVTVKPYRSEPVQEVLDLELPREIPPGRLVVRVGDGLTLSRLETREEPAAFAPDGLEQLIWLLNHIRAFNRIYAHVAAVDEGILVGGTRMPNLPPSVAQVLLMPQAGGNFVRIRQRGLLEESLETEHAVTGYRKLFLEVVP
jgi:hypothetical protein